MTPEISEHHLPAFYVKEMLKQCKPLLWKDFPEESKKFLDLHGAIGAMLGFFLTESSFTVTELKVTFAVAAFFIARKFAQSSFISMDKAAIQRRQKAEDILNKYGSHQPLRPSDLLRLKEVVDTKIYDSLRQLLDSKN